MRFPIEDVTPSVACGRYPAKAVVGELVPVGARAYREGHDALGVNVVWTGPDGVERPFTRLRPGEPGSDRWHGTIQPDAPGSWTFAVEAFSDPYLSWRTAIVKKIDAGQSAADLANDLEVGARVLDRAAALCPSGDAAAVTDAAKSLRDTDASLVDRVEPALELAELLWAYPVRDLVTRADEYRLAVDRKRALFSAWYEMFPRSEGIVVAGGKPQHGTFATAAHRLPGIAAMGFDIVYLPPIHPIGKVNRKGRNNALTAAPGDVGSPWAIGSDEGGHDAIHPQLGTLADFREFVAAAAKLGLEVALDLALQCAPDHPWVKQHPEWFTTLPDGSIAYAENPPKKYQDIYPVNFDNDPEGIRAEVLRVVRHWISNGVKVFRVDNPHTKPVDFWQWLISTVKAEHPDVLFLAEAFTAPAMMHGLGRVGFTQSYTYFTWRTTPREMREYCEELVASADWMRPNFWPNTPDILPAHLQTGGPVMFKIRAVLASLLSPSWGLYSGYELYEHVARPGAEEYADNEKYQLRARPWAAAEAAGESLAPFLTRLNEIRRQNPALHWLRNLRFHEIDNEALLCWSKVDADTGNAVLVICSFDPG
ncbi:MAG TPA: alpha-1,4-glucan--maltose-1-phosphate maltosyltransferase, partial [Rugosimonospora sp.]|nr:alpha-1,4-glucan--maltose-1-phosphate maltosyltransferase [Rugosimonospora sp.]